MAAPAEISFARFDQTVTKVRSVGGVAGHAADASIRHQFILLRDFHVGGRQDIDRVGVILLNLLVAISADGNICVIAGFQSRVTIVIGDGTCRFCRKQRGRRCRYPNIQVYGLRCSICEKVAGTFSNAIEMPACFGRGDQSPRGVAGGGSNEILSGV